MSKSTSALVRNIVRLAPDVVEVCVQPSRPVHYLPGHHLSVRFRGYPARCYSPTVALHWPSDPTPIRFQVRQIPDGRVSSALGRKILAHHRLKLTGPFGSAYLRPKHSGRLVLVSTDTGFAAIWAIAEAAIRERPERELVMIAATRSLQSFYMVPALLRLALFPQVTIVPVVSEPQAVSHAVQQGRPTDYLPPLNAHDVVYAAGAPAMVETVKQIAKAARATCYSDPFRPDRIGVLSRAARWLTGRAAAAPGSRTSAPAPRPRRRRRHGAPDMVPANSTRTS